MVKSSQFAAAAAMLALAAAMPMEKRGVTIQQGAGKPGLSGQAAYLKALRKYGASQQHIGKVDIDPSSVTATSISGDLEYLCPVEISGTTFNLDFDTGSSDLWVFGPDAGASGHPTYSPGSDAKKLSGASWKISYGDGSSASGDVYTDTVTIGQTVVTGQAVEVANQASSQFTSGQGDGLVGLAFDSINTVTPTPQKTFFSNAIAQGLDPVLACDLKKGAPGSYTFGQVPFSGVTYTPVDNSQGFWTFTPDSGKIGSQSISADLTGIADTGTTLLLVDDSTVSDYYGQVQGATQQQSQYVVPCDATLPDFTITVGGYDAVVPGSYINYADNGDGTCYGGIQSSSGIGFNIYGDIFLKSQNVVFDHGKNQLGLAAKS